MKSQIFRINVCTPTPFVLIIYPVSSLDKSNPLRTAAVSSHVFPLVRVPGGGEGPRVRLADRVAKLQLVGKVEHKSTAVRHLTLTPGSRVQSVSSVQRDTVPVMWPPLTCSSWKESQIGNISEVSICIRKREPSRALTSDSSIRGEACSCGHFYVTQMVLPTSMMSSQFRGILNLPMSQN